MTGDAARSAPVMAALLAAAGMPVGGMVAGGRVAGGVYTDGQINRAAPLPRIESIQT